jgi:hypothetical protein
MVQAINGVLLERYSQLHSAARVRLVNRVMILLMALQ